VATGVSAVGGAIFNEGTVQYPATLYIDNCTFSGNSSRRAGGIVNYNIDSTATINNSTFSNNTASVDGGALRNNGTMTINNSTITGNSAGTSGGGIVNYGILTIYRNIISGNSGPTSGAEIYNHFTITPITSGYNVVGYNGLTTSAAYSGYTPSGTGDYNATSDANNKSLAEILTTLANNGGPTQTFALPSGSPAIDRAPNNNCTPPSPTNGIDQRGAARNYDVNGTDTDCDSGAVEFRSPTQNCTLSINTPITIENVTFNFSSLGPGPLGCVTVEEMGPGANHLISTGTGPGGETLETGNWWYITGDNIGFTTSISLTYNLADADTRVCKWPGGLGGSGWDCGNSLNTSNVAGVSVTRSGITSFSDWTVGQGVGPTAVTLFNINVGSSLPWVSAGLAIGVLAAGLLLTLWQVKIRKQAHG